jgi:putative MFS transporter
MEFPARPTQSGTRDRTPEGIVARIECLPGSFYMAKIRLIIGFATFFDGFDSVAISYALPVLIPLWHLSPTDIGWLIGCGALGQMAGALVFGRVAERIGRLPATAWTIGIFSIATLLSIFAQNEQTLFTLRIIQGVGLGGQVPIAAAYINEISKAENRGRFVLLYESIFALGLFGAALIGRALVPSFGWQAMFVVGALPLLVAIPLRKILPESARWLLMRGRTEDAANVLDTMEAAIIREGKALAVPVLRSLPPQVASGWRELFGSFYLKRTMFVWALALLSGLLSHGLINWLPSLYKTVYHLPTSEALSLSLFNSVLSVCGPLACALAVDRIGRRAWFTGTFLGTGIALGVLALVTHGAPSVMSVVILAAIGTFFISSIINMIYLYIPELYPTRIRATGSGAAGFYLRLGNFVAPMAVGYILVGGGIDAVFGMISIVGILGVVLVALFGIETRKRVLEEVSP